MKIAKFNLLEQVVILSLVKDAINICKLTNKEIDKEIIQCLENIKDKLKKARNIE